MPSRYTASYTCPALTDLVGAPGEQEIELDPVLRRRRSGCGRADHPAERVRAPAVGLRPASGQSLRGPALDRHPRGVRAGRSRGAAAGRLRLHRGGSRRRVEPGGVPSRVAPIPAATADASRCDRHTGSDDGRSWGAPLAMPSSWRPRRTTRSRTPTARSRRLVASAPREDSWW